MIELGIKISGIRMLGEDAVVRIMSPGSVEQTTQALRLSTGTVTVLWEAIEQQARRRTW